jgi:hypothetical protein
MMATLAMHVFSASFVGPAATIMTPRPATVAPVMQMAYPMTRANSGRYYNGGGRSMEYSAEERRMDRYGGMGGYGGYGGMGGYGMSRYGGGYGMGRMGGYGMSGYGMGGYGTHDRVSSRMGVGRYNDRYDQYGMDYGGSVYGNGYGMSGRYGGRGGYGGYGGYVRGTKSEPMPEVCVCLAPVLPLTALSCSDLPLRSIAWQGGYGMSGYGGGYGMMNGGYGGYGGYGGGYGMNMRGNMWGNSAMPSYSNNYNQYSSYGRY